MTHLSCVLLCSGDQRRVGEAHMVLVDEEVDVRSISWKRAYPKHARYFNKVSHVCHR